MLIIFLFLGAIGGVITATLERMVPPLIHSLISASVGILLAYFIGGLLLSTLGLNNPWFWVAVIAGLLYIGFLFLLAKRGRKIR